MDKLINVKCAGLGVGDTHEWTVSFDLPSFDLYSRHHEVTNVETCIRVTQLAEGLFLNIEVVCQVSTTCDRTLEPLELALRFGESELLVEPNDPELYVEDWELNVSRYAIEALPSEVPMQVFCPDTDPVESESLGDQIDPRWRGLDNLFVSGF